MASHKLLYDFRRLKSKSILGTDKLSLVKFGFQSADEYLLLLGVAVYLQVNAFSTVQGR